MSSNSNLGITCFSSEDVIEDFVVVLGDFGLNGLGFAFGSCLGLNPLAGTGDMSSSSMLAKISSMRLFSVVEVVVVGLNPGGKNFEMSSCSIVPNLFSGFVPLRGGPRGFPKIDMESSTGILANKSLTVFGLFFCFLVLSSVCGVLGVLVVDVFLGKNLFSLCFSFSAALCPKALFSLFVLPLLFFVAVVTADLLFSLLSSLSSCVIFCPKSLCRNKSAKERGLNVVVVVVRLVGRVRILNKLSLLVVDSVVDFGWLMIAQGSKADCNLSSASCILAWLEDDDELEEDVEERDVETLTLTLGICS